MEPPAVSNSMPDTHALIAGPERVIWSGKFRSLHTIAKATHTCEILLRQSSLVVRWVGFGLHKNERSLRADEILGVNMRSPDCLLLSVLTVPPRKCKLRQYELTASSTQSTLRDFEREVDAFCQSAPRLFPSAERCTQRIMVIINPTSGQRRGAAVWEEVRPLFELASWSVDAHQTRKRGDATELAREADLDALQGIVVVGGDGTFNEVLTGLLGRSPSPHGRRPQEFPLAIIPAGTDGTLPKFITKMDPVVVLRGHRARRMDVLKLAQAGSERLAACGASWGIPGQVASDSEPFRPTFGVYRYAASTVKHFLHLKPVHGSLVIQPADPAADPPGPCSAHCKHCDRASGSPAERRPEAVRVDGSFLIVGCTKTEKQVSPHAHLADGCMDVFVIRDLNHLSLADLFIRVGASSHLSDRRLQRWKATSMQITPSNSTDVLNVDGEVMEGAQTDVSVLPGACTVLYAAW